MILLVFTDGEGLEEALDDATRRQSQREVKGTLMDAVNLGSDASGRKQSLLFWKMGKCIICEETRYKESMSGRVPTALLMSTVT